MSTLLRISSAALGLLFIAPAAFGQYYTQTNLVSNTAGEAPVTDPSLVNPWGLSRSPGSPWWVSDNATGLSTLYAGDGTAQKLVVKIPAADPKKTGSPTGTVYNGSSTDFMIAPGTAAVFLFSTIDGTIAGWNPKISATQAVTVIKTTDKSVFTGMTVGYANLQRYLYLANFSNGRVDVYDRLFHYVSFGEGTFEDTQLPPNYVPFNVQTVGSDIVVTYALHEPGQPVETDGPGFGYVDIYSSKGELLTRLDHGDWLNAPWGVALAPHDFGFFSHALLVAQFAGAGTSPASGYIAAYDFATGKFLGLMRDATGKPIQISGVWAISPGNVSPSNADAAGQPSGELYFSAGPNHGAGGLLGYLTAVATDQVEGNDQ